MYHKNSKKIQLPKAVKIKLADKREREKEFLNKDGTSKTGLDVTKRVTKEQQKYIDECLNDLPF